MTLIVLTILSLSSIGVLVYSLSKNQVKLVTLNGREEILTGVTPEEFTNRYDDVKIIFNDKDIETVYTYAELGIKIQWTEEQKQLFDGFVVNLDAINVGLNYSEKLDDIINSLGENNIEWKSAQFIETDTAFVLEKEIEGDVIHVEDVKEFVLANLGTQDLTVVLDDFRESKPENFITADVYEEEFSKWDEFLFSYTNGFMITKEDIKLYFMLTEDYKIVFREEMLPKLQEQAKTWVYNGLESLNTLGGTFKFKTYNGEEVELEGVNYGDKVNKYQETEFLVNAVKNLESHVNRTPIVSIDYPDDIQSNTIEISLDDQHLWYWKDGEVIMETDIVTGWKDKWDTPTGVYRILNKIDGVYLEGSDYKTWVDKWMRFWEGYGLHDATWRNKFGGNIYTWNGSHGCINLPHSFAVDLYDLVKPNDCVVIY